MSDTHTFPGLPETEHDTEVSEYPAADAFEQVDTDADDSDPDGSDDTDYESYDDEDDDTGQDPKDTGPTKPRRRGIDRGTARRIAAKAVALQNEDEGTLEFLKTLLSASSADPVSLTLDIMVSSPAEARRVGNSLVALRTQFDDDPMAASFAVMELDRASLDQVWRLVHALGQNIPARPPAATGKAVRPLASAIGGIDADTLKKLTDAIALTVRS